MESIAKRGRPRKVLESTPGAPSFQITYTGNSGQRDADGISDRAGTDADATYEKYGRAELTRICETNGRNHNPVTQVLLPFHSEFEYIYTEFGNAVVMVDPDVKPTLVIADGKRIQF